MVDKEKQREAYRKFREEHPERARELSRASYRKHRERIIKHNIGCKVRPECPEHKE